MCALRWSQSPNHLRGLLLRPACGARRNLLLVLRHDPPNIGLMLRLQGLQHRMHA